MPDYRVKVGFWLPAYDTIDIEADSFEDAIERAKEAPRNAMEQTSPPEHIDIDERREGLILTPVCQNP